MVSMFGDKKKLMIDMNEGIVGTFIGVDEDSSEADFLFPMFVPFNKITTKKYRSAIPKSAFHPVIVPSTEPFAEKEIMFIYDQNKPSLLDVMESEVKKENERLKREINNLRVDLASSRQEATDASSGAAKAVSRAKDVTGFKKGDEHDYGDNPFGGGF